MHDLTALQPLNQQDVIWLAVADRLAQERELEALKADYENRRAFALILQDIRLIGLNLIPFKSDMAFKDFLTTLPSYDGNAEKDREENRWKVKKRKPGDMPEWKRRKMAEIKSQSAATATEDKKTVSLSPKSKVASERR